MIQHIDIQGHTGIPIRALLIPANETSPNFPDSTVAKEDTIEFYDSRYPHTPDGQFITRYLASTLKDSCAGIPAGGLDMMGYIEAWKLDGRAMKLVLDWIAYHQYIKP